MFYHIISRCVSFVIEGRNVKSLELYLDTLGGENKVLYRFDFDSINLATENFSGANIISQYSDGYMYKVSIITIYLHELKVSPKFAKKSYLVSLFRER